MIEPDDIFAAVDWAWVYVFPPVSVIALIIQLVNQFVLFKGRRSKRLNDPVYVLWIAYGMSDIFSLTGFIASLVFPNGAFTKKWLAWFDWGFGWYPSLYMQTIIALYYVAVLSFPVWYFKNSDGQKLRNMVYGAIVAVYAFAFILVMPMMMPEGSEFTDKMNEIYFIYAYADRISVLAPFICYCFLAFRMCTSSRNKVEPEESQSEIVKKKRIRRMLKIAFISWTITASSMLSYDVDYYYAQGSPILEAIMYVVVNATWMMHMSASPIIQFVRNSSYRHELGMAFGCMEVKTFSKVSTTQNNNKSTTHRVTKQTVG